MESSSHKKLVLNGKVIQPHSRNSHMTSKSYMPSIKISPLLVTSKQLFRTKEKLNYLFPAQLIPTTLKSLFNAKIY